MAIPNSIKSYLNKRGISDATIENSGIIWDGNRIVIPVKDINGQTLFNKYRRSPLSESGPKYSYDKGATAQLYNIQSIDKANTIVITEGELDTLVLESHGIPAVSSTGGSGTFREEWGELFTGKEVFICYDNDIPGVMGALNVQGVIRHAKIIELPSRPNVKDVTDFFIDSQRPVPLFTMLMANAHTYSVPGSNPTIKELNGRLVDAVAERRRLLNGEESVIYIEGIIDDLVGRIELKRKKAKPIGPSIDGDRLQRAKSVSILSMQTSFMKFNRDGFSHCLWHSEKSPSMHYIASSNRVHCFGCGKHGDAIDVYMQIHKCTMKQALEVLAPKV